MSDDLSIAYKLFHMPFAVQVPQQYLYSDEHIKLLGIPTTRDKDHDRALMSSPVDISLTAVAMAVYLEEGATIAFPNPDNIPLVYAWVQEHLKNWAHIFTTLYPLEYPPLEDFVMLDNLAKALHPFVSRYGNKPVILGIAGRLAKIRATNISRVKHQSIARPELFEHVPMRQGTGDYKSTLETIIIKLRGPEYERATDEHIQGDNPDRNAGYKERRKSMASRDTRRQDEY